MNAARQKLPLYKLLVTRGLCSDERHARSWILAGKILVDEQRIDKAGQPVSITCDIRIKGLRQYVGKGGYKLEGALSDFAIDVSNKVVLDAGAAAGGFTDCLLQRGASKVYAVDVGFGSLAGKLRSDDRVVNLERTNISDLSPAQMVPPPTLATVDLSYLSLKKAIPIVAERLSPKGQLLCLVKPLFEIADSSARRSGIIKSAADYRGVLRDLLAFADTIGFSALGLSHSHLPGGKGTVEFFLYLSKTPAISPAALDVEGSILSALALQDGYRR